MYKKIIGSAGERFAEEYLIAKGHKILERQYRTNVGEIDIISYLDGVVHFIEVKTRRGRLFGYPAEAVNKSKLTHIKQASEIYISKTDPTEKNNEYSIDVIEVVINHIEGVI